MQYLTFEDEERNGYRTCLLVTEIRAREIVEAYVDVPNGIDRTESFAVQTHQFSGKKKTPVAEMKAWINEELQPVLDEGGVRYVVCSDAEYFKVLTGKPKTEAYLGYVVDSAFGHQKVIYVPNYRAMFYDPEKIREKIQRGLQALVAFETGDYREPGTSIIQHARYPRSANEIEELLGNLHRHAELTCDIEGFSLKHYEAGIGTITFCWSKHKGIAFPIDYHGRTGAASDGELIPGMESARIRHALRTFFEGYKGKLTFHSIGFDVTVLIYQLFMDHILDTEGLLKGLDVFVTHGRWDCTKLITYLATNSCAGNRLDLKSNSQEFSGNYSLGDELKDITKIEIQKLLEYNLVDGLSTWFLKEKYEPVMDADNQRHIYESLFKPAMVDIIQMQLTGMPVNMTRSKEVDTQLNQEADTLRKKIAISPIVRQFERDVLEPAHVAERNSKLKKKQIAIGDEPQTYNPGSDLQTRSLLFGMLDLPVINLTDTKLPSCDGESIEALINRTQDPEIKELLENLQLLAIVGTLTTNFMPSILGAVEGPDGWYYLFGSFNLGGTLSGRLSSSGPNLQNLPSTGKGHKIKLIYAKMIKSCFEAPPGWLFVGADFPSLEDRISALTTKDPNKLKVYTDGYDGHSLRAFAYFGNQMPDIVDTVESINSIQKKYKPLRDRSKNPTFTLTYQGTYHALMKKYGFSLEQAQEVERLYHELYKVSDQWVNEKLDQAMSDGYITAAFGLRLRTPLLAQVIRGTSRTPYEAEAEGRTAGNALGQSWCLLNSRAWVSFMRDVRKSDHKLDIRPCAQIHDAGYALIRDDVSVVKYVNDRLPVEMAWQDHPDIWHDDVKLAGAQLGIFYPNWNTEITIPTGASEEEILQTIDDHLSTKGST